MRLKPSVLVPLATLAAIGAIEAQQPSARQIAQERAQAELDAPKLADVLEFERGMSVADIGAGGGAVAVVLARWLGSGRMFATDIGSQQLATIRKYAAREGLDNVTVIEGAADATNLPRACCDAIFLRHVYHHMTEVEPFNRSLHASLKPGGRLAIIDFVPGESSRAPDGVPASRRGHGITPSEVIAELTASGLMHVKTIDAWPPGDEDPDYFLVLFRRP